GGSRPARGSSRKLCCTARPNSLTPRPSALRRALEDKTVTQQALSTEPVRTAYGPVIRRALITASAVSLAIVAVAAGPALVANRRPLVAALARPPHAPDLGR